MIQDAATLAATGEPSALAGRREACQAKLLELADRRRWWVAGGILLLYLAGFNGQWAIDPDSALYLSIARNLATGQGYTYQGQLNHLAYPGLPWLAALTFRCFGTDVLWPIHVILLAAALASLGLAYLLFKWHAGRPTAVLLTAMLALCKISYYYGFQVRNDVPFFLGVMAFFAGYEGLRTQRGRRGGLWLLMGLGTALACIMRPAAWVLLPVALVAVGERVRAASVRWKAWLIAIPLCAAVGGAWLLDPRHSAGDIGHYESYALGLITHPGEALHRIITLNVPRFFEHVAPRAIFGAELGTGFSTVAALAAVALGIDLARRRLVWGLWVALTVIMLLVVQPEERYFLPILPFVVYGWWLGAGRIIRRFGPKSRPWGLAALLAMFLAMNIAMTAECLIQQRRVPFLAHYKRGEFPPLIELAGRIEQQLDERAQVLASLKSATFLSYRSHRRTFTALDGVRPDAAAGPLYVLEPLDESQRQWMAQWAMKGGPALITVRQTGLSRSGQPLPPLVLRQLLPAGKSPGAAGEGAGRP